MITTQKRDLAEEIKRIDETINHKELLQNEYVKRNENLPLKKKIFSVRILSKLMSKEREEKLEALEKLNSLLNPKKFVAYKKEMEQKEEYLKLLETKDLEKEIENMLIKLQKLFLKCYKSIIEKIENKNQVIDAIYEFRYYSLLPFNDEINISEAKEMEKELKEIRRLLLNKAQSLKVIIISAKDKGIDEEILKHIFTIRAIALEEIYIKLTKEKDKIYIQLFDEDAYEEKIEMHHFNNINKKDLEIKLNKKIKVFE